jgi:exopolysaccharide production protein ExoQ
MPPAIATALCAVFVVVLFALDRDRAERTSTALWIPVIWMTLAGSRTVSQWFGLASRVVEVDQALDGDPLDRAIQAALISVGLMVLFQRGSKIRSLLRANAPLVVFFSYCAVSIVWSDYPAVAFKRWTKAVGDIVMILVVLTESDPTAAVKRLLGRLGLLLVPASILLIKYYPALGQGYGGMSFKPRYTGVTMDKNMLGAVCLVAGLGCLWRLNTAFRGRATGRKRGPLITQGLLLVMVLWLLFKANSMTSLACFVLAGGVILVTGVPRLARKRALVNLLVVSVLGLAFAALFLSVGSELIESMGRETTLASRTELWEELLAMKGHPLFGTGFESFWLGKRLDYLWSIHWWHPNEAHNGYIEVLLNLGWIGVTLLAVLMVSGYRNILGALRQDAGAASLMLGFFVTGTAYAFTEAAFRPLSLVWIVFVLSTIAVPKSHARSVNSATLSRTGRSRWTPASAPAVISGHQYVPLKSDTQR